MPIKVRIPTPLRSATNGRDIVELRAGSLAQLLDSLEAAYPGIKERLVGDDGDIRHFVNMYVNGEDVRFLQGLGTTLKDGDELSIVPAVAGG
ncbi:MAG: MoaD/ThiS family protein [Dehalococcoidia bacterium]|nr:MoaD/ThiS family protein [Dehalococcoidia bacterium]